MFFYLAIDKPHRDSRGILSFALPFNQWTTKDDSESSSRRNTFARLKAHVDFMALANHEAFQADLERVAFNVNGDYLEFACYMLRAHWSLEPGLREAREQKIDAEFKHLLGASGKTGLTLVDRRIEAARSCLKTLPDAYLSMMAANMAYVAKDHCMKELLLSTDVEAKPRRDAALLLKQLYQSVVALRMPTQTVAEIQALGDSIVDPVQMHSYCEACKALLEKKEIGTRFLHELWTFHKMEREAVQSSVLGLGAQCVIDCAGQPPDDWKSVMVARHAEARLKFFGGIQRSYSATRNALESKEANVLFGIKARNSGLKVLKWLRTLDRDINKAMRPGSKPRSTPQGSSGAGPARGRGAPVGRMPGRGRGNTRTPEIPQMPTDPEALRSEVAGWSIDQLVRWIEGPVTRKREAPLVTAKIIKDQKERETAADKLDADLDALGGNRTTLGDSTAVTPMVADEINLIVQAGLRASADFFSHDLADTIKLAESLKLEFASHEVEEMEALKEALAVLQKPAEIKELEAYELFGKVEAEVNRLRAKVEDQQRNQVILDRFAVRVADALNAEAKNGTLFLGRRAGGRITLGTTAPLDHWQHIYHVFHGRLLSLNEVKEGGVWRPLKGDEALALYVTGSSESGAAFCVSVHLWRRFKDSDGNNSDVPPAGEDGLTMNSMHWYDTYIPCCVLHVEAG